MSPKVLLFFILLRVPKGINIKRMLPFEIIIYVLQSSATQSVVRVPVTVRMPSSAGTRIFSRKERNNSETPCHGRLP